MLYKNKQNCNYSDIKKVKFLIGMFLLICFTLIFCSSSLQSSEVISITAVGDMVFPYYFENWQNHFSELINYFNSDLNLGNLEGPITNSTVSTKNSSSSKMFAFKFSPEITPKILKYLNFHGVLVSNNHSFDYGEKGFNDTLNYLKKVQIEPIGLKNNVTKFIRGNKKIAIIGFYYSSKFNDLRDINFSSYFVKKVKEDNDFVIVFFHGGTEGQNAKFVYNKTEYFGNENRGNIFAFAHAVIDAGADLVLGSGPHILRGFELYKGKFIAYSLGNFVASGGLSVKGELSLSSIFQCNYDLNTNQFLRGKIIPIDLSSKNPRLDLSKRSIPFLKLLTNQIYKDNFNSSPNIDIDADGNIFIVSK